MQIENVPLSRLRENEGNPRKIVTQEFLKLINSILTFPRMMEIRPIVIDGKGVTIGGNQRLAALMEIASMRESELIRRLKRLGGYQRRDDNKKNELVGYWAGWLKAPVAPIVNAVDLTPEECEEFIIKDNANFGEWDFSDGDWPEDLLSEWLPDPDIEGLLKNDAPEDGATATEPNDSPSDEVKKKEAGEVGDQGGDTIWVEDRIYPSDNSMEIPTLRIDRQPSGGLLLPFSGWGTDTRAKKGISTYHFYVDDYRFLRLWKDPVALLTSGCLEVVEPNLSLFDTTPLAYGLQQIYMKRWLARYWQESGIKVYADLNVAAKFYEYNRMGIPEGYNAFATRGYADRLEYLKDEIRIAREISRKDAPNMIVYGGGDTVKELCMQSGVLYVEQFIQNRKKKE